LLLPLQIVQSKIDLPLVRLACRSSVAAWADPSSASRGPPPDGQSAQITATPWPGPIPQLRLKIKGWEPAAVTDFSASAGPKPHGERPKPILLG